MIQTQCTPFELMAARCATMGETCSQAQEKR